MLTRAQPPASRRLWGIEKKLKLKDAPPWATLCKAAEIAAPARSLDAATAT